ncbi:MAG: hypothetical protein ACXWQR_11975 [Ktedonobacterales bacterium]
MARQQSQSMTLPPAASVSPATSRLVHPALTSVWAVAVVVAVIYAVWLTLYIVGGHPPTHMYGEDGTFCYRIALNPGTIQGIDVPAYRYTRILYPMVAWALGFGQQAIIPYTLVLVNYLAVIGGTLAVAAWLRRRAVSPWYALLYGCYPGLVLATAHDINEPLAYGLVALAIYLFDYGAQSSLKRAILSAGIFALASLARETTLVFALLYAAALLLRTGPLTAAIRRTIQFLLVACVPFALYKVFLWRWLGTLSVPDTVLPQLVPFGGLIARWPWSGYEIIGIEAVVVPCLLFAALAVRALWRGRRSVEVWSVLVHVELFTVMLAPYSFADLLAHTRIVTGTVLAATLCLPATQGMRRRGLVLIAVALAWATFIVPWLAFAILTRSS